MPIHLLYYTYPSERSIWSSELGSGNINWHILAELALNEILASNNIERAVKT